MRGRWRGHRGAVILVAGAIAFGTLPAPSRAAVLERAPDVPIGPDAISTTVELGRYAVNGTVRAAVADPAAGATYIGGDFTRIGVRTGSVVVVDPPGVSDGALRAGSPEVMGAVGAVFPDDRAGDPGFFIVGFLTAINGQKASQQPVHRMHLVNGAWVVDTSWTVTGECTTVYTGFPVGSPWIATPTYLIGGGMAGPKAPYNSTTGLMVIDRASGRLRNVGGSGCLPADNLLPSIPPLPDLTACASLTYCQASAGRLAWDSTSQVLLVEYGYAVGTSLVAMWSDLVAYDLTAGTGGRSWRLPLQAEPGRTAVLQGWANSLTSLPGAFLAHGRFPLDPAAPEADASKLLLIDATAGTIRQRWNRSGEQDPSDGSIVGPATPCHTAAAVSGLNGTRLDDEAVAWLQMPSTATTYMPCRYALTDGRLAMAARIGTVQLEAPTRYTLPTAPYADLAGTSYLLGSNAALDLTHGSLATWDPDPAMTATWTTTGPGPSVAVIGGNAILGGAFTFVRGTPAPGVAALDATLAPVPGFDPDLVAPEPNGGTYALALSQGRLLVGGVALTWSRDPVVALDAATGAQVWAAPSPRPVSVDTIAVDPGGDFWFGGTSGPESPAVALQHYAAPDDGFGPLAAPVIGCLAATPSPIGASSPLCSPGNGLARVSALLRDAAGSLYVAGAFGSIDGAGRHGLARFEPDGTLGTWDPDLLSVMSWSSGGGLDKLEPRSMAVLGDNLVVGGSFVTYEPSGDGSGHYDQISPLLVFSVTTAGLVRPTDPARLPWFTTNNATGYAMAPTDAGLAVALGGSGMAIFDSTTLELDETASAAYMEQVWFLTDTGNGVYTVATPGQPGSTSLAAPAQTTAATASTHVTAVAPPTPLVIGGVISRWRNRVAGNVVRTTIGADTTAPTTSSPRSIPLPGRIVSSGVIPVRVTWTGSDPHGSGVGRYQVAMSTSGGAYVTVGARIVRRSIDLGLRPGRSYRFRVRAIDNAGNVGAWASSPTITLGLTQQSSSAVRYSGGWKSVSGAGYLGGSAKKSGVAGASATFTFTGRAIGFVSLTAQLRGRARVYVDGRYVKTIDLRSSTAHYRVIVFARSWTSSARHTLRIVVSGTAGRPRIDADAFVVIR